MQNRESSPRASGLYGNESFRLIYDYEVERARRYPSPLTVVHIAAETADASLEARAEAYDVVAEILHRSLRISDVPTQFDEEFLVLLPATDVAGGRAVAERVLAEFKNRREFTEDKELEMFLYLGFASRYVENKTAGEQLLAEASVAMNEARAKQAHNYVAFADISKNIPRPSQT
jgi:GGDEF domain-containing protein